jgi:preprotein translocase subunit SecD
MKRRPETLTLANRPLSALLLESGAEGELLVAEQDVQRVQQYLSLPGVADLLPRGSAVYWDARDPRGRRPAVPCAVLLERDAFLTGERLEDAQAGRDPQFGQTVVTFQLDRQGGRAFDRVTAQNIGRRIAIVLDGQVHSAPSIRTRIGQRADRHGAGAHGRGARPGTGAARRRVHCAPRDH